jgi:hypothetical protein
MEFNTSDKANPTPMENQDANLSAKVFSEMKDGKIDFSIPAIKPDANLPEVKIDGLPNDSDDTGKPNKEKEFDKERTPCQGSTEEPQDEIDKKPEVDRDRDTDKNPDNDTDSGKNKELLLKPGEDVVIKRQGNPSE